MQIATHTFPPICAAGGIVVRKRKTKEKKFRKREVAIFSGLKRPLPTPQTAPHYAAATTKIKIQSAMGLVSLFFYGVWLLLFESALFAQGGSRKLRSVLL